jgi:8-oxo-dGTP diphosphatase
MVEVRALATDAVIVLDGEVVLLERAHSPFEGS